MNLNFLLLVILWMVLVIDWAQTRTIAKNPWKWTELNPIIGSHPSLAKVNTYFVIVIALSFVLYWFPIWLVSIFVAVEAVVVVRNFTLGISIS